MLIYQPGVKFVNFGKVASIFLLILILNTLIFGHHSSFSLKMRKSEPIPILNASMDRNSDKISNTNKSVSAALIMNKKDYIHENENIEVNLSTRFEAIDVTLVKEYAPILNFHPNEGKQCCFPSSAEDAYQRAKQGKTGKNKEPKLLKPESPCYYEALNTKNGFRIKYWFWYNYNDYPTGPDPLGSHPGDWEYIEIYFENERPFLYQFSNHSGARIKDMKEITTISNQVEVWVGSGSHANYESSNPENIHSVLGFPDLVAAGGAKWNTANNLVDIRNTNFYYDNFMNDWGDGKKIYGPLNRMDK